MRTSLNIEPGLIERAAGLTGIKEKTALVRLGLKGVNSSCKCAMNSEVDDFMGRDGIRGRV